GIAVETLLDDNVVVGGNEEVAAGGEAANPEFDAVAEEPLPIRHIDDSVCLASEDLLHGKDVADVVLGEAGAEALREGDLERAAIDPDELVEIEKKVDAQVVGCREAVLHTAAGIDESV